MAVDTGLKKPSNCIIERGMPQITTKKVENVTSMTPGVLVKKGTTDAEIVVCGDVEKPTGVLLYEFAHAGDKPADIDTAYALNASAPVGWGKDFTFQGFLKAGEAVSDGDQLVPAASGQLKSWVAGTDSLICGTAAESIGHTGSAVRILVKANLPPS